MTAANKLTVSRVLLVPLYLTFLYYSRTESNNYLSGSLVILLVVAVGDVLDGYLARRLRQVTPFGSLLDPVGDKMILWVSFIIFAYYDKVPAWLAIVVVSKDVLILGAGLGLHVLGCDTSIVPNFWGKASAFAQFTLVLFTISSIAWGFWDSGEWIRYTLAIYWAVVAVLAILSGISYAILEARRLDKAARA